MKKPALLALFALIAMLIAGCSGSLGHDSPTQVRLDSTAGTTNFASLHVIVVPDSGAANSSTGLSDTQTQAWGTVSTTASSIQMNFTTNSTQVPYFVYVQNTSAVQEQAQLAIYMDGNLKTNQTVTIPANSTVHVETIFRNNTQNP